MGAPADRLGEQLQRERLLDIENRLSKHRLVAFAVLGIGLLVSGPWLGWWWLIPLAATAAAFLIADRQIASSGRPETWVAVGWAISPLMIATSVALTGAAHSPAVGWFALPAITLAARYEGRDRAVATAYVFVLLLLCTVAIEPGAVIDDPTLLSFPIALLVAAIVLSTAVVQSDREHRRSAVLDPLTGLLNRAALAQRVAELEEQVATGGERTGVAILVGDLDNFKAVNDTHGHSTGDEVLRDAAYAIRNGLRAFDLVYRFGGEEFLVLLPGVDSEDARTIAERLRRAVAATSRPGIAVSISIGGCTSESGDFRFARMYEAADSALYAAKQAGRDRVVMSCSEPGGTAVSLPRRRDVDRSKELASTAG